MNVILLRQSTLHRINSGQKYKFLNMLHIAIVKKFQNTKSQYLDYNILNHSFFTSQNSI